MESSSSTITDKNAAVEEDYGDVDGAEIEEGGGGSDGGRVDAAEIECGGGGGGGRVDAAGNMICNNHTFKVNNSNGNNPVSGGGGGGGICAFCLQDKLGKLVSSSFPLTIFPSSSSSSPSFRSELDIVASGNGFRKNSNDSYLPNYQNHHRLHHQLQHRREQQYYSSLRRGGRIIPFLLYHQNKKKNKKKETLALSSSEFCSDPKRTNDVLKRSKSTATPRSGRFLDVDDRGEKRGGGFWSFLYHTKSSRKTVTTVTAATTTTQVSSSSFYPKRGNEDNVNEKEKESPNGSHENVASAAASSSSFERKVSRSRSVGCGSRSFHGDFFDRISTGLGDCTLRRVESQREAKSKAHSSSGPGVLSEHHQHHYIKERVKCGGIFGGFILTSSLSSSSSSSYWISSSADDINTSKTTTTTSSSASVGSGPVLHNRSKSWGWALASPIRAFSKPSSNKNGNSNKNNTTTVSPNLSAIPSLLSVSS